MSYAILGLSVLFFAAGTVLEVQLGAAPVDPNTSSDTLFRLALLSFAVVGSVINRKRPEHRMGWLFSLIGAVGLMVSVSAEYALRAAFSEPPLPGAHFVAWLNSWIWAPWVWTVGMTILVFPEGRLPSRRWRAAPFLFLLGPLLSFFASFFFWPLDAKTLALAELAPREGVSELGLRLASFSGVFFPASVLLPAVGQVIRFRKSQGQERQQLKWLAFAVSAMISGLLLDVFSELFIGEALATLAFSILGPLGLMGVPVAAGIAILRYRLYDIDVVINRALVYAGLTAALGAGYFGAVVFLQTMLRPFTAGSDLSIAGSTLAVAALFRPARRGIQALVDRRFYRRRYDAALTLEEFSSRLRSEIDLDSLGKELSTIVKRTMQPASVSLWMPRASGNGR